MMAGLVVEVAEEGRQRRSSKIRIAVRSLRR